MVDDSIGIYVSAHDDLFFAEVIRNEGGRSEIVLHATPFCRTATLAVAAAERWLGGQDKSVPS